MSNVTPMRDGNPMTAEQRKKMLEIRHWLGKQNFPMNAERSLADAIVGIIDCLLPGAAEQDKPAERASG